MIVLNTYDLLGEDINRKQAWQALKDANIFDIGYEYFRRTYKDVLDGKGNEDELKSAIDGQVQSVIEPVLWEAGLLDDDPADAEGETDQATESVGGESETEEVVEEPATAETSASRPASETSIEELQSLRDRIDLLREQAEYEAAGDESPE